MLRFQACKLSLAYNRHVVVKNLSFTCGPGEILGLVGPNGSGKSTLIRALSGVIKPLSGRLLINGASLSSLRHRELAKLVSVVPQFPLLPSAFTAYEVVLMGRNPHLRFLGWESPQDIDIAWQAMEMMGIDHLASRRVDELSGGEIQSVTIARAIAQRTEAMLLDEPTSNLDIGRQVEVLDLISELSRRRQITVVMAIHDLNLASQYCDRIVLLNNGCLVGEGSPSDVICEDNIRCVYGAGSIILSHPLNGAPVVIPCANRDKHCKMPI